MRNPKEWFLHRRAVAAQFKAEGRRIGETLKASPHPPALRRTVAYVALYGGLTETQFQVAHSRDPLLRSAGEARALVDEAAAAGLVQRVDTVDGHSAISLTEAAASHRGWFLAGGRTIVTQRDIDNGFLNRSPGRTVTPAWNAVRDFGV